LPNITGKNGRNNRVNGEKLTNQLLFLYLDTRTWLETNAVAVIVLIAGMRMYDRQFIRPVGLVLISSRTDFCNTSAGI
jgi:hypothetical protein